MPATSKQLENVYEASELRREATLSILETVQREGERQVTRRLAYYSLDAMISVDDRVNATQAIQFRIWATALIQKYVVQDFSSCGMIDTTPDHRPTITSTVALQPKASSTTGSSLVVTGPGRMLCDDDGADALDAQLIDSFQPGESEIYVGHLGQPGTYRLEISETNRVLGRAYTSWRR